MLDLGHTGQKETIIEGYEFEPIKGYPMLNWRGKRPFRSTHFYPAQLKESYGEETDGWMNQIFWGDNLQVMSHLLKKYRGQIDLIYIDPPFDSKADYKKKILLRGKAVSNDGNSFEEKQYTDIWTNDEYLQFIYERMVLLRELLSEKGSILLHCDWRKVHLIRNIFDEIFGASNFMGHIVWRSMTPSGFKGKSKLGKSHDDILYYCKNRNNFTYNPIIIPYSDAYIEERFSKVDENGRRFKDEKIGTATTTQTLDELKADGKIYYTASGTPRIKHYLDESNGYPADDIWSDIYGENSQSTIQTGYPTQKPEALLERIIKMTSNPGDLVFDCFMGSGTTQSVSMKLGRRFLGADINLGAIQTTTKRLIKVSNEIKSKIQDKNYYLGFQVFNVNHYDVFRNPVEAKELLLKALEIEAAPGGGLWDGEKDGRMVKVMPINRIATRADLNAILSNVDLRTYEIRKAEQPNRPVEQITLVCMGHEPDLAARLKAEMGAIGYKVDIEVVDVLRDGSRIEFKRDSEADISIENNQLLIREFYPMNLLQKLSLMREDGGNWKELVESVLIDWNYDGAVLEPTIVDIPEGSTFVRGVYPVPTNYGTIRIKITDVLSESLELTIQPY